MLNYSFLVQANSEASSETQGQSVGSGERAGRKFSSTGERAPGYRLSPNYSQKLQADAVSCKGGGGGGGGGGGAPQHFLK